MGDNTAHFLTTLLALALLSGIAVGADVVSAEDVSTQISSTEISSTQVTSPDNDVGTEAQNHPPPERELAAGQAQATATQVTASQVPSENKLVNLDPFYTAIKSEQALGPYNPTLSESFYNLGLALQHNAQHLAALDSLRRALHIIRVNSGIYSLAQTPVLHSMIDSHRALNRVEDTTADYYHLLWLHQKAFGDRDPRLIPVLNELSHWHLNAYALDPSAAEFDHLTTSHSLNSAAIDLAQANSVPYATRVELLRTYALTSFFLAGHEGNDWRSAYDSRFRFSTEPLNAGLPTRGEVLTSSGYRNGRVAYEEIISVLEQEPTASAEEKIRAYAELGDWYLLFNRRDTALATYAQALTLANQITDSEKISDQFFASPQLLPAIGTEQTSTTESNSTGHSYVEARLDVSKTGMPSKVEIVASLPEDDLVLRRTVKSRLKKARFRPRFVNGVATDTQGMLIKIPTLH